MSQWIRDVIATVAVGAAVLLYVAWLLGFDIPAVGDVAALAATTLILGVVASASAVVPGFSEMLRGSRSYLALASVLGIVALVDGVWAYLNRDAFALAVLVLATVILWAMSTWRHLMTAPGVSARA